LFAEASGVPLEAQKRAVARAEFGLGLMTDKVIAEQQAVADRFQRLGLIPEPIKPPSPLMGMNQKRSRGLSISEPTRATGPPTSPISSRSRRPPTGSVSAAC
jgi:hypothetical protein